MRTGIVAKKIGMSSVFEDDGSLLPITLLHVSNTVVNHKTREKDGYDAVQLGMVQHKVKNKPMLGYFKKQNVSPFSVLCEFRISRDNFIDVGSKIGADCFEVGSYVDVKGITIGKGFAGPMKRHNFKGLFASHGVSISHRSHGSTGQCQDPGRTFKGKKMAGHLGGSSCTKQNLKVVHVDKDMDLIGILGAVPGHSGSFLKVVHAIKKSRIQS